MHLLTQDYKPTAYGLMLVYICYYVNSYFKISANNCSVLHQPDLRRIRLQYGSAAKVMYRISQKLSRLSAAGIKVRRKGIGIHIDRYHDPLITGVSLEYTLPVIEHYYPDAAVIQRIGILLDLRQPCYV